MEYFFNIATPEEIAKQFPAVSTSPKMLEHTRAAMEKYPDYNYQYLAYLYWGRGDKEKAEYYRQQIKSYNKRLSTAITLYELRED